MNKKIISASILSADFANLGQDIDKVLAAGADWIHFDVMDNHFVPNLTVGPLVCKALRDYGITAPIDVHLMVNPSDRLIADFSAAGASWITIHPEANPNIISSLKLIKQLGCKAGVALNPATPIDIIADIYEYLDLILIMSVNPGFAGQQFIESSLDKITELRNLLKKLNSADILLGIDGGVKSDNIQAIAKCGIDVFVAGSSIFRADDYIAIISKFQKSIM
jgi:ribulose-phosphate 3-epimerase